MIDHPAHCVELFHVACGVPIRDSFRPHLRISLISEEYVELMAELRSGNTNGILKECCDLIYVAFGTMIEMVGADGAIEAFRRVHASNMSKTVGGAEVRPDGKILKGPHYRPATMDGCGDPNTTP